MTTVHSQPTISTTRIDRYGYNTIARHTFVGLFIPALVFLAAGTTDWSWGWVFAIVHFLCWGWMSLALARWNPDLLNARGKRRKDLTGTKTWDWVMLSLYGIVFVVQPVVAGLDYRYGWSSPVNSIVYVMGNLLFVIAYGILISAMVTNRNFEGTVRIQEQRGHQVISSGPYRYVRHPGYVAVILTFLALPAALGTWAALIPGLIGVVVFIIRTALEDRTLQAELPGYAEFAQRTRHRLIPGVW